MKIFCFSICLFICFIGCQNSPEKDNEKIKKLTLLSVQENKLYPLFDSVINFEKRCNYFEDSLYFSVFIYSNEITFESGIDKGVTLFLDPIGYFVYKEHYFFVHKLDENWLSIGKEQKKFTYTEQDIGIIDDSWTMTTYSFKDGEFILKERYSFCE